MGYHVYKDEVRLAWMDNRDQVKLDLRKLLRRVENEVLKKLEDQFVAGIQTGELLQIRPPVEALTELVADAAKQLTP